MEKLLVFMLILVSALTLWVKDVEIFLMDRGYREVQYGVEHAVHAASLQVDKDALSNGRILFQPYEGEEKIRESLQKNLALDDQLRPISTVLIKEQIIVQEVVYFDENFIDPNTLMPVQFPYVWSFDNPYTNERLERVIFGPSVALVLDVKITGTDSRSKIIAIQEYKADFISN